jgi:hypothetical protein
MAILQRATTLVFGTLNPLVASQEVKLLSFQRYKKASEFHNFEAFLHSG